MFEEWTTVFPGKMGLSWKRGWFGVGSKEDAEAMAARTMAAINCNTIAIPLRLWETMKDHEARMVAAENALRALPESAEVKPPPPPPKNEIEITISGKQGIGKTSLGEFIAQAIGQCGIEVVFDECRYEDWSKVLDAHQTEASRRAMCTVFSSKMKVRIMETTPVKVTLK